MKLALGCWAFGDPYWGQQDDRISLQVMGRALDRNITHFDTATSYGRGHSEQLIGRFLRNKRQAVYLGSKQIAAYREDQFRASIEKSLRRLNTDYLDVYYVHWARPHMDLRPTMLALAKAKEQGLIRSIGVSNLSISQMDQMASIADLDVCQLGYNLLWRFGEKDIIPYCQRKGIELVTYSSIAQGILAEKYPRNPVFSENNERGKLLFFDRDLWPCIYEGVTEIAGTAAAYGRTCLDVAIRWLTDQDRISSVLVGARTPDQLDKNAAALTGDIKTALMKQVTEISERLVEILPFANDMWRHI